MAARTGIDVALPNQIGRNLYDIVYKKFGFVAMLKGLDMVYGAPTRIMKSNDTSGSKVSFDFRTGTPTVSGVNAVTGALGTLLQSESETYSTISAELPWSHYQLREDIRTAVINKVVDNPKTMVPWVKKVAESISDAILFKLSQDLFPDDALTPTRAAGGATGVAAENRIMALAYPLQVGRDGNDPAAILPATYDYAGIDLNDTSPDYTRLRATNEGTYATPFATTGTPSLSNLRRKLIMPMRNKGAMPDLGICDNEVYDYFLTTAESKVVLDQTANLEYGGETIKWGGLRWMVEDRLSTMAEDASNERELYILQSDTWEFRQKDAFTDFGIQDHPSTKTLKTILGYFECALICHNPRFNARGVNIVV